MTSASRCTGRDVCRFKNTGSSSSARRWENKIKLFWQNASLYNASRRRITTSFLRVMFTSSVVWHDRHMHFAWPLWARACADQVIYIGQYMALCGTGSRTHSRNLLLTQILTHSRTHARTQTGTSRSYKWYRGARSILCEGPWVSSWENRNICIK